MKPLGRYRTIPRSKSNVKAAEQSGLGTLNAGSCWARLFIRRRLRRTRRASAAEADHRAATTCLSRMRRALVADANPRVASHLYHARKRSGQVFGAAILGMIAFLASPVAIAQSTSLVLTTTTGVATGLAAPGASMGAGFDEALALNGRFHAGALRLSALVSASFSTGLASMGRWSVFSSGQTLRWSWPAWTSGSTAPGTLTTVEIQEVAVALSGTLAQTGFKVELGKFPLTWGVGKAFRPSDIFRTMDYASLIPTSKGVPAARLSLFPTSLSRFEAVASIDGDSTLTAGVRYLTALGDTGALAASGGWCRQTGVDDEYSGSLEAQLDVGAVTPYTELSIRGKGGTPYAVAMLGSSLAVGDISVWVEVESSFGLPTAAARLFLLGTWRVSELTSISVPLFWFDDARVLSASTLAQLQGILGGRLDLYATGNWRFAAPSTGVLWKLGASWTRSLSTY